MRPVGTRPHSPIQLLTGITPSATHLRIFGCAVYVPIPTPVRSKMSEQRQLGIYVGYNTPSILRYLDPHTGHLFLARFKDCVFDESLFPSLGGQYHGDNYKRREEVNKVLTVHGDNAPYSNAATQDPRTSLTEIEVARVLSNQSLALHAPDGFNNAKGVVKDRYTMTMYGKNISYHQRSAVDLWVRGTERNSKKQRMILPE